MTLRLLSDLKLWHKMREDPYAFDVKKLKDNPNQRDYSLLPKVVSMNCCIRKAVLVSGTCMWTDVGFSSNYYETISTTISLICSQCTQLAFQVDFVLS
jgi:hypothetical protein